MDESRPYKDDRFITAQVLSVIGVCLTFSSFLSGSLGDVVATIILPLGLVAMIILQIAYRWKMTKGSLITAGVLSTIAGVTELVTLIVVDFNDLSVSSVIGGISLLFTGILVFVFVCGEHYETTTDDERMEEENVQSSPPTD